MDELELLKSSWKKQENTFQKLSYNDIYNLLHKKSSSIVKWIFIICIAEFVFWGALTLFIPESLYEVYEKFNLKKILFTVQNFHFVVMLVFIYFFYKNFKSISVIDNTKVLMKKIISTRNTVNYYVYYNLALYAIISIISNFIIFSQPDILMEIINPTHAEINEVKTYNMMLVVQIISLFVFLGILYLYYRLIYGILLKRLSKNYKDLSSLEF
jgi:hypothetical protein